MDVTTTFLHDNLAEQIFMEQYESFIKKKALKIKFDYCISLHGLK